MRGLPLFRGEPVHVALQPGLTVSKGRLLSNKGLGTEVHAACYLPERRIVLDSALLRRPRELRRILIHELFHFVWWRLGNPRRDQWSAVLRREISLRARGELGWSAELQKQRLPGTQQTWALYRCESFCDTAAWRFTGGRHGEYTLAPRFRAWRRQWLDSLLGRGPLSI